MFSVHDMHDILYVFLDQCSVYTLATREEDSSSQLCSQKLSFVCRYPFRLHKKQKQHKLAHLAHVRSNNKQNAMPSEDQRSMRHKREVNTTELKNNISLLTSSLTSTLAISDKAQLLIAISDIEKYSLDKMTLIDSLLAKSTNADYVNVVKNLDTLGAIVLRATSSSSESFRSGTIMLKVSVVTSSNFGGYDFIWPNKYGWLTTVTIPATIQVNSEFAGIVAYGITSEGNENEAAPKVNDSSRLVSSLVGVSMVDISGNTVPVSVAGVNNKIQLSMIHSKRELFELPECMYLTYNTDGSYK